MKITFLGTGTSTGNPEIGCGCEVCTSTDKRDWRLRASVLVETAGKRILIDCGPDFRWQAIRAGVARLDGILITHEHYDHVGGLDDLRPFCHEKGVDIYAEENVAEAIRTRIPYVFRVNKYPGIPNLILHPINNQDTFSVAGIDVIPIRVMHNKLPILGFRIGNFAYLTDLSYIPEEEFGKLKGLDVLVIDALKKTKHLSHETVGEALENIKRIAPKKAYLIHMSHRVGLHAVIDKELPPNVYYSFDGLVLDTDKLPQTV